MRSEQYVSDDSHIRCQACSHDTDLVVDAEHLLLVRCQPAARALEELSEVGRCGGDE
jgi:hypothetical protein